MFGQAQRTSETKRPRHCFTQYQSNFAEIDGSRIPRSCDPTYQVHCRSSLSSIDIEVHGGSNCGVDISQARVLCGVGEAVASIHNFMSPPNRALDVPQRAASGNARILTKSVRSALQDQVVFRPLDQAPRRGCCVDRHPDGSSWVRPRFRKCTLVASKLLVLLNFPPKFIHHAAEVAQDKGQVGRGLRCGAHA